MTKKEILEKCKSNRNYYKESVFSKYFPEEYENLISIKFPENFTFQQKLYHWVFDINETKVCKTCGKPVKFLNPTLGYREYCSSSCSRSNKDVQNKQHETCMKKYGDPNYNNKEQIKKSIKKTFEEHKDEIVAKTKRTKKERYGDENYRNDEKRTQTNLEKYGSISPFGNKEIQEKTKETCLERYGDEKYRNDEKRTQTNLEKYGSISPFGNKEIQEKTRKTNLERYSVENVFASNQIQEKIKKTNLKKYGAENVFASEEIKEKIKNDSLKKYGVVNPAMNNDTIEKRKKTNLEKYGVEYPFCSSVIIEKRKTNNIKKYGVAYISQLDDIKSKIQQTVFKKYGVYWSCLRPEARKYSNKSKPNTIFAKLLDNYNIIYESEFPLYKFAYDFKVNNNLIEINPTITHNSYLNIFDAKPLNKDYHLNKSNLAKDNGYHCIHVWDWDDEMKIVNLLKQKTTLYARNLVLKEVDETITNIFLNTYHLQNTCKGQIIRLGLYLNDELIQIMTFGKPRYNKKFEYELLRLCTHSDYIVVGGAEKMFKHFIILYKVESVISYCDYSKFTGNVYKTLGFELYSLSKPAKHWYNGKTKQHITDNLLRQRGFDQLFNTDYGKGTNNEELMLQHKFLPVYDCGQMTFVWSKNK